jgi:hypothetical protein
MGDQPTELTTAPPGDPRVEAVVARLDGVDGLELADQARAFGEMQAELAAVLDSDEETGPTSGA